MINSLWISKTGMEAQQTQLDVISNNLANVSTNGFKRGTAVFEDLMYQNLRQVGANATEQSQLPTGLHLGLGVRVVSTTRSFAQGTPAQSGNRLKSRVTCRPAVAAKHGWPSRPITNNIWPVSAGRVCTSSRKPSAQEMISSG